MTQDVHSVIDKVVTPDNVRLGHTWLKQKLKQAFAPEDEDPLNPLIPGSILFTSCSFGKYLPQVVANSFQQENVSGVLAEDFEILKAGPDHEHYWEAWITFLDNGKYSNKDSEYPNQNGEFYFHQSDQGDLWLVPVPIKTKFVLGHEFHSFTKTDWYGYAGAEPGSYICHVNGDRYSVDIILSPSGQIEESIIDIDGKASVRQWDTKGWIVNELKLKELG